MKLIGGYLIVLVKWMTMSPSGSSDIFLTNETDLTWTEATHKCTLAQPAINFKNQRLNITPNVIPADSKPWVGFVAAFTVFDYQGCWKTASLQMYTELDLRTRAGVGVCYSACRTDVFATNKAGVCKCIQGVDASSASEGSMCNKECEDISCGSDEDYMSVYRLVPEYHQGDDSTMCHTVSRDNTTQWRSCSDNDNIAGFICKYHYNTSSYHVVSGRGKWFNLVQKCPSNGHLNATEMWRSISDTDDNKVYWTSRVGTPAIYEASMGGTLPQAPVIFGYAQRIEKDDDKFKLAFRGRTSSALCKEGSSDSYLTNETDLTWKQANSMCILAQPTLTYEKNKESLNVPQNSLPEDSEPWVGFLAAFTVFDYQGCWTKTSLEENTEKSFETREHVGLCYSACLTDIFAINKDGDCKCLHSLNASTVAEWSKCDNSCDGISCGAGDDNYLSVYRLVPTHHNKFSRSMCLTVSRGNKTEWRSCADTMGIAGFICNYHLNTSSYRVVSGEEDWFNLVERCHSNGNLNADEMWKTTSDSDEVYWTSRVGTPAVYEASTTGMPLQTPVKFGYAETYRKDKYKLSFGEDTTSSALCQRAPTTTSVPTRPEERTTTASTMTAVPTTPDELTASDVDGTTSDQSVTLPSSVDTNVSGNNGGLYIGVGVGLALVVASAVVILVILHKRRKRFRMVPQKRSEQNFVNADYENNSPPYSLGESGDIAAPALHEYAIIEPTSSGFVIAEGSPDFASENVYDVSREGAPRPGSQTEHVYNVAGSKENVYDHTTNGGMFVKGTYTSTTVTHDNVYDVSGPGARTAQHMQSNNIYNTFRRENLDGNEYDLTRASGQRSDTDNVYNTASGVQADGNMYDVTGPQGQMFQADNIYNTAKNF